MAEWSYISILSMGHELVRALRIDRIGAFLHSFGLPHFTQGLIDADRLAFVASTVLLLEIVFWSSIIFYMGLIERWNVFDLQRFAIRRMQSYPSKEKLQECLTDVLLGHFLIRPFVLYISYPYIRNLLVFGLVEIPNPWTILWQFLFCTQVDDFLFYWLHRLSHVGWFYKNIHKRHHEFKHTVAIAVEWAHPVEDIVVNTIPTVLGPLLLRSHVIVFWLYICAKLHQSIDAHSGYSLPFPLSPWTIRLVGIDCAPAHYFHHSVNIGNYGGFTMFWDWFCGTDIKYREMSVKDKK